MKKSLLKFTFKAIIVYVIYFGESICISAEGEIVTENIM